MVERSIPTPTEVPMKHSRHALVAFAFLFAASASVRADDEKDALVLVEKAIKAHGGEELLKKYSGSTAKIKGTVHAMGMALPMSGEVSLNGTDQLRVELEIEAGGQKISVLTILNKDKGWVRIADNTMEFSKEQVASAREQTYAGWVANLYPLKGKEFSLATTGEQKIGDQSVLGVKVAHKGHNEVTLYFDKETGMLAKYESNVKDDATGQEVLEEKFMSGYKAVKGLQQPMKITTKRDGKLLVEGEVSEVQLFEKLDESLFTKP